MTSHLNPDGVDRDPFAREALKTLEEIICHCKIRLTKASSRSVQDTHYWRYTLYSKNRRSWFRSSSTQANQSEMPYLPCDYGTDVSTHRRPGDNVDSQPLVDRQDISEGRKHVARRGPDVEVVEINISTSVVIAICCPECVSATCSRRKSAVVLLAEKSVAPRGTRMYEKPAELDPSVTKPSE